MTVEWEYDAEVNRVHTEVAGTVTAADFAAYCEEVLADERIQPGFLETLTLDPECGLEVKYSDLHPFRDIWRRYLEKGARGTVTLATSPVGFGIFRMFPSVIEADRFEGRATFELVRSQKELEARVVELIGAGAGPAPE